MRVELPFLFRERRKNGQWRYRFRRHGKTVTIPGQPGSPEFMRAYDAARGGEPLPAPEADTTLRGSLEWLIGRYLKAMEGRLSPSTLKQRTAILSGIALEHGDRDAFGITSRSVRAMLNSRRATPHGANNLLKALKAMYAWTVEAGMADVNPIRDVPKMETSGKGYTPWSAAELQQFLEHHKSGSQAHLAMMLLIFTACRRQDLARLGREHLRVINGVQAISWFQDKTGHPVDIPVLPPLAAAIDGPAANRVSIIGRDKALRTPFLVTSFGRPYAVAGLGNKMQQWTKEAGLSGRSAHGVRKSAGGLLAELGCSEHEIMAVLGHTNPRTSAIYTRSANRWALAVSAMERLRNVNIG
ncbi:site-specific integrase [Oceanicella sp. SM1341]|uniref:tyrosine-type recombinase/integrase n=1 Tax=Oceanicella sp. SM1341 TaxID=1548889 RepID=UPI0013002B72|nr:site-specific integrase [Oceanicella sp. SM1341]